MFQMYPASPDSPAFVIPRAGKYVPLLAFTVHQTIVKIIMDLQLKPSVFTFHSFRRSGDIFLLITMWHLTIFVCRAVGRVMLFVHIFKPPMLHIKLLHLFKLYYKIHSYFRGAWGLNPLFLPSRIFLNNITKITIKCLVVINGSII